MNCQRIKTQNNNFLYRAVEDEVLYFFYTDEKYRFLREASTPEWRYLVKWNLEIQEMENTNSVGHILKDLKEKRVVYTHMLKKGIDLKIKRIGKDERQELFDQLDEFVLDNFDLLYEGAIRCSDDGLHEKIYPIEKDYYAPDRVQVNRTRLHRRIGLKYADGHRYDSDYSPCEETIINTVKDIQFLIDKASEDVKTTIKLNISKGAKLDLLTIPVMKKENITDAYCDYLTSKDLNKRTIDVDLFEGTIDFIHLTLKLNSKA